MEDTRHPALQILTDGLDDDIVDAQRAMLAAQGREEKVRTSLRLAQLLRRAGRDVESDSTINRERNELVDIIQPIVDEKARDLDIDTSVWPNQHDIASGLGAPSDKVTVMSYYVDDVDFEINFDDTYETPFNDTVTKDQIPAAVNELMTVFKAAEFFDYANNYGSAESWDDGVSVLQAGNVSERRYNIIASGTIGEVRYTAADIAQSAVQERDRTMADRENTMPLGDITSEDVEATDTGGEIDPYETDSAFRLKVFYEHSGEVWVTLDGDALVTISPDYSITVSHWGKKPEAEPSLEDAVNSIVQEWRSDVTKQFEEEGHREWLQGELFKLMQRIEDDLPEYGVDTKDYAPEDAGDYGERGWEPAFSIADLTVRVEDPDARNPKFDIIFPDKRELTGLDYEEMMDNVAWHIQGARV